MPPLRFTDADEFEYESMTGIDSALPHGFNEESGSRTEPMTDMLVRII